MSEMVKLDPQRELATKDADGGQVLATAGRWEGGCLQVYLHAENGVVTASRPVMLSMGPDLSAYVAEALPHGGAAARARLEQTLLSNGPGLTLLLADAEKRGRQPAGEMPVVPEDGPHLDPKALYGLAGEVVGRLLPVTEADAPNLLVNFLVQFGSAAGRHMYTWADGCQHFMNVYGIVVGETNTAKGTGTRRVKRVMEMFAEDWGKIPEARGLSSGEVIITALADADPNDPEATERDRRMLCVVPEFGVMLKMMGREGNSLGGVLREAWDDGTLCILTKSATSCTRAHVSFIGHVTPAELAKRLSENDVFNGFANRFLFVRVRRSKALPEGNGQPQLADLVQRLRMALCFAMDNKEMKRDPEAAALWAEQYPHLTRARPDPFGAVVGRAVPQVLRLSMLYAALDQSLTIKRVHLEAALALWDFCEQSAALFWSPRKPQGLDGRILEALRAVEDEGLSLTHITRVVLQGHTRTTERDAALARLQEAGLCFFKESGSGNKKTRIYYATPEPR